MQRTVFGVKDNGTGELVEFSSNPTNLFMSQADAEKALKAKNGKLKEDETPINGTIIPLSLHQPVIARGGLR
jgi:hypothetical protein